MPFKSEKQRRYLWATQPDLAKRWAHKYPESNKNLPMYAHENKKDDASSKSAALSSALQHVYNYVNVRTFVNTSILAEKQGENAKNAADECVKVKIPHSNRPTYAGEEREKGEIEDTKVEPGQNDVRQPANAINSLLQKISAVLAQPILQAMENETAAREGRQPVHQPKNHGIKRYPQATPSIPLPMGMQAPAQPAAQPQPAPAQPQKAGMGMNSPSANPINSFGALSSTGNINGNAAFGQKNSPDSLKTGAAQSEFLAKVTSMDFPPHPDPEDLDLDDEEYMQHKYAAVVQNAVMKWAAEDKKPEEKKPKKPSAGAAMYVAGLQGNDAWARVQKRVNETAKRENPGGIYDKLGPLNDKALNLRARSIAHQAVTPSTRILSDALGGHESLGGIIVNSLGAIGGGPEVQDKVRKMYGDTDIDSYRDKVKEDAPVSKRETRWHQQLQGIFADKDYAVAAHRWNRANHPYQYWLNPFDRTGPLQELNDRIMRRHMAGAAEPDTFGGRVARNTIPFAAPFMGGEEAQDKMRATAHRGGVYGPSAEHDSLAKEFGQNIKAALCLS